MLSTKTVQQEINRLVLDARRNKHITSSEGAYFHDLCSIEDKTISIDDFYRMFPYHNPDFDSEYWQKQHNRWREIWKQN